MKGLLTLELETGLVHISVSSAFAQKVILHCAPILILLRWVVSRGSGRLAHCLGNADFFRGKVSAVTQILRLPVGACTSASEGKWNIGVRLRSSRVSRMAIVGTSPIGSLSRNLGARSRFRWRPVLRGQSCLTLCSVTST